MPGECVFTLFPLPVLQAQAAQQARELADAQAAAAEAAAAKQAAAAAAAAAAEREEMKAKATLILTQLQPPVSSMQCTLAVFVSSHKLGDYYRTRGRGEGLRVIAALHLNRMQCHSKLWGPL